ncbi:MAG: hypothetical protein ACHQX3_07755 [Nitrospirales bacterium]
MTAEADIPVEEQELYVLFRIGELRHRYDYSPKLKKYGHVDAYKFISPDAMKRVVQKHCARHSYWRLGVEPDRKVTIVRAVMKLIRQDAMWRAR